MSLALMLDDVPSLKGCGEKCRWAKRQLDILRAEITAFRHDHPHEVRAERHRDACKYVFYIEGLANPPSHWGLRFGDSVHNLRSALDHLVVQLGVRGKG